MRGRGRCSARIGYNLNCHTLERCCPHKMPPVRSVLEDNDMPVDSDSQMRAIDNLLEQARQHYARADLYSYFDGDEDRVAASHVALDTVEDTRLALSNYESNGIGFDDGERYLRLYGFLQATILQQDAIRKLHELFVGSFPKPADTSAWMRLRELRNLTVGHPIAKGKRGETPKRAFIARVSLKTDGFNYQVSCQSAEDLFVRADLLATYVEYKQEATEFLKKVLNPLSGIPDELH